MTKVGGGTEPGARLVLGDVLGAGLDDVLDAGLGGALDVVRGAGLGTVLDGAELDADEVAAALG